MGPGQQLTSSGPGILFPKACTLQGTQTCGKQEIEDFVVVVVVVVVGVVCLLVLLLLCLLNYT